MDRAAQKTPTVFVVCACRVWLAAARALYVNEATVKTHVNRIFAKTGSRDRTQAMRYAFDHGYADPPGQAGPPVPRPDSRL